MNLTTLEDPVGIEKSLSGWRQTEGVDARPGGCMRILLIEDDYVLGEAVRDHIAADGHGVDWMRALGPAIMGHGGSNARRT